jgi:hypothetical protein
MKRFWVSTPKFTASVHTDDAERITFTAPILHRFRGQELWRLGVWIKAIAGDGAILEELS